MFIDWNNKKQAMQDIDKVKTFGEIENTDEMLEAMNRDKDIAIGIIKKYPFLYESLNEELKRNKDIVLAAVETDGWILEKVVQELQENPEVLQASIKCMEKTFEEDSFDYTKTDFYGFFLKTQQKLESILKEKHTPSEIAEGIVTTQIGMGKVEGEMVAYQNKKNDPNKDERPGEEPGDN